MGTDLAPCRRRPCTVALPKHRSTRTRSNTGSPPRRAVVAAVLVAGADGGGSGGAAAAGGAAAWWGTGSGAGARGGEHGENDRSQTWETTTTARGGVSPVNGQEPLRQARPAYPTRWAGTRS